MGIKEWKERRRKECEPSQQKKSRRDKIKIYDERENKQSKETKMLASAGWEKISKEGLLYDVYDGASASRLSSLNATLWLQVSSSEMLSSSQ